MVKKWGGQVTGDIACGWGGVAAAAVSGAWVVLFGMLREDGGVNASLSQGKHGRSEQAAERPTAGATL